MKIIVINNNVYSIIRRRQKDLFRNRTIGTDPENGLSCPALSKLADCFGFNYLRINSPSELSPGLHDLFSHKGPLLCEIMGRPDQGYIESGFTSTLDKRFVRRPLEDQHPFMSRDLFTSEMIVNPIDQ